MKKNLISIILILFTSLTISQYAKLITPYLKIEYSFFIELLIITFQIALQWILLYFYNKSLIQEYTYHKSISFGIGSLALWFFMGVFYIYPVSARVAAVVFIFCFAIIYAVHQERVYSLKLPYYFSYSWLIYRTIISLLIIDF